MMASNRRYRQNRAPDYWFVLLKGAITGWVFGMLTLLILGTVQVGMGLSPRVSPQDTKAPSIDSLLQMDSYPPAPEADYFYAFKHANVTFERTGESIVARIEYRVRIKVLTESTEEASIVEIPYYYRDDMESVSQIQGTTYQPDGEKRSLNSSAIRTINLNTRYNVKEFTMPAVQEGSVVEYGYTVHRKYIEELPDFYFAHRVPTDHARITVHNPRYLRYKAVPVQSDTSLQYQRRRVDTSDVPRIFTVPRPEPLLIETWSAHHLPAVKDKPYLPSVNQYRSRIKFQMSEFGIPRQPLDNSWELVAAKIRRNSNPLEVIDRNTRIDTLARKVKRVVNGNKKVQDSLFRLVNKRMRYNGNTALSAERSPDSVLQGTPANQAAINQTLLRLLREAGIEKSWPLLISTSDKGMINKDFPSPLQFNAMLVLTSIRDSTYIMDASYSSSYPGLIPKNMNYGEGMLLRDQSMEWVDVTVPPSRNEMQFSVRGKLTPQGDLIAVMNGVADGYSARVVREKIKNGTSPEVTVEETFFPGYNDLTIDSVHLQSPNRDHKSLNLDIAFTLNEYAQDFKSGLRYNPMILGFLTENPFKSEMRQVPVFLDAPEYLTFDYRIRLPGSSSFSSTKSNRQQIIPGGVLSEQYQVEQESLSYQFNIEMSDKMYPPEVYPQFRSLYQRWVELSQQEWFIRR